MNQILAKSTVAVLTLTFLAMNLGMSFPRQSTSGDCRVVDPLHFVNGGGGCQDVISHLAWSSSRYDVTQQLSTQPQAISYCSNLTQGGVTGWRLPTLAEVQNAYGHNIMGYLAMDFPGSKFTSTMQGKNFVYIARLDDGSSYLAAVKGKVYWTTVDAICVR